MVCTRWCAHGYSEYVIMMLRRYPFFVAVWCEVNELAPDPDPEVARDTLRNYGWHTFDHQSPFGAGGSFKLG
jgi:hypothetical protein